MIMCTVYCYLVVFLYCMNPADDIASSDTETDAKVKDDEEGNSVQL